MANVIFHDIFLPTMLLRQERAVRVLKTGVQQSRRIPLESNRNFAWLQSGQRSQPLVLSEGGTLSLLSMLGNPVGDSIEQAGHNDRD